MMVAAKSPRERFEPNSQSFLMKMITETLQGLATELSGLHNLYIFMGKTLDDSTQTSAQCLVFG